MSLCALGKKAREVGSTEERPDMAAIPSLTFGALLKRHRIAAGLTQEELAAQAGLSPRGISDLERGERRAPRKETVQLIADALNLSPAERATLETAARQRSAPPPPTTAEHTSPSSSLTQRGSASLVGRARELQFLTRQLVDGPPLLLVAGEPGIGKSRLLQAGIEQARNKGWVILTGGCHRRSGQEPYAPFVSALERSLQSLAPAQQRQQLQGCTWLVHLLPELAEMSLISRPTVTLPPEQERRLMFAAIARYLGNIAGPAGTLLVLDDLHWAGPDALDLLQSLVRVPTESPLRILGAYRDTDVAAHDPLANLVADLARENLARRILLAPLPNDEATTLLEELLPETPGTVVLRQRVLERAGGVPFFLISCVQALQAGHKDSPDDGLASEVPWTVAETIRQRVMSLPVAAQEVLNSAAIVGRSIERDILLAVTTRTVQSEEDLLAGLQACCRGRLLLEEGEHTYLFAHDLIREVVLADLGVARRGVLHRRVAEALEQGTSTTAMAVLAYHYTQAGDLQKAVIYLQSSGDAALARHANAEAAAAYREVVARLEELGRTLEAARWREKLGNVLVLLTQYDEALDVLERACETYRQTGNLEGELRALAQVGRTHRWRGTSAEGLKYLLPLLKALPKIDASQGAAAFYIALAYLYIGTGQYSEQLAAAEQAAKLARAMGDDQMHLLAQERIGSALFMLGRLEEARQVLANEVIPAGEATGNQWLLIDALGNLGAAYEALGEYPQGRTFQERAVALAERLGGRAQMAHLIFGHGMNAFCQGEWKQAHDDFTRAASLAASVGRSWSTAYPAYGLGLLALAESKEEAISYLTEAKALAERNHDLRALCWIEGALAEQDLLMGRPEAACARLTPLLKLVSPTVGYIKESLILLAWAELESGEVAQAQARLEEVLNTARTAAMRPTLVGALRVQALLLSRQGLWAEAEAALEEALALCRDMSTPYIEAKTQYVSGLVAFKHGRTQEARLRLDMALASLRQLGERLYASRIEQIV